MTRSLLVVAALASFALSTPALAGDKSDECVRVGQVRAFVADSDTSVIVRQGRSQFRRIVVDEGCPVGLADRIGFAQGPVQLYVQSVGGRSIPVGDKSITSRFCTGTPHAYITLIQDGEDRRARCRIRGIEPADATQFEAAGQVRDNRY